MSTSRRNPSLAGFLNAALILLCLRATSGMAAQYGVLHNFAGGNDGYGGGPVTLDTKGNLYGASGNGGSQKCRNGCGLLWGLKREPGGSWRFATLYDFASGDGGAYPNPGLVLDAEGDLYGTSDSGGSHGEGAAFELLPGADGWTLSTLYAFCSERGCPDVGTTAPLAWGQEGELYGTSSGGGSDGGEVFELAPGSDGWTYTLIHTFKPSYYNQPAPGGSNPYAGLIVDAAGNLYGTTYRGGADCNGWSCGVVYELTPLPGGGWKEIVLHRFYNNGKDGVTPGWGALLMDSSGRLYGTTQSGGSYAGVVFQLTPAPDGSWKESIPYDFKEGASGNGPNAGVVMDSAGDLYGTTDYGGNDDCGVIYKLAPRPKGKWAYTVLHAFNGSDGCLPEGNLVMDSKGNLYGGTILGGAYGSGVIFELTP